MTATERLPCAAFQYILPGSGEVLGLSETDPIGFVVGQSSLDVASLTKSMADAARFQQLRCLYIDGKSDTGSQRKVLTEIIKEHGSGMIVISDAWSSGLSFPSTMAALKEACFSSGVLLIIGARGSRDVPFMRPKGQHNGIAFYLQLRESGCVWYPGAHRLASAPGERCEYFLYPKDPIQQSVNVNGLPAIVLDTCSSD